MKRIREFLESIAFAGLKPSSGPAAPPRKLRWLGPLQSRVEKFLAGGPAPDDPLYLSNRSFTQKIGSWSLIAIPCLVLALGIGVTMYVLEPPESKPIATPTPAQISAKILPGVNDVKLAPPSELQVVEIKVESSRVTGTVHNTSRRDIPSAELVIDLTNSVGSQVGAVSAIVEKIPASGQRGFALNIKQRDAAFALVREINLPK